MEPIIRVEHLCKTFDVRDNTVHAAKDISFDIERGDIFGIIGLSGAGKSTLVRCLNLLEKPTSGKAVSYTHLDVYKRQALQNMDFFLLCTGEYIC